MGGERRVEEEERGIEGTRKQEEEQRERWRRKKGKGCKILNVGGGRPKDGREGKERKEKRRKRL